MLIAVLVTAHGAMASPPTLPPTFNGDQRPFTIVSPIEAAPITPIHTARGGVTNLTRYRGKVVLLNIWATWCEACLYELPALDRLQTALGGENFTVVTVSVDEDGLRQVRRYFDRLKIRHLPRHMDPAGRMAAAFGVREGLPWSFIIDRQGRTQGYLLGSADWDSEAARTLLNYYISRK